MVNLDILAAIDAVQIGQWIELGGTIAFAAVGGFFLLGFIRGLFRGWRNGTYRLVMYALMIGGALLLLNPEMEFLKDFDIGQYWSGPISFTFNNTLISASMTTSAQTGTAIISQLLVSYGVTGSSTAISELALAIALSLIKFVLLIVDALLIITLGQIFVWLMWHILFKFFTPKAIRKNKKLRKKGRLISALEEGVIWTACIAMLLMPFTSLLNTAANNIDTQKVKNGLNNETVSMVCDGIDTYKTSMFYKYLFEWSKDEKTGQTWDAKLVNYLTTTAVNEDNEFALFGFLEDTIGLANDVIGKGFLSLEGGAVTIDYAAVLTDHFVSGTLEEILSSDLVQVILPVAIDVALNMEEVKNILGQDTCSELQGHDADWWTDNLEFIGDIVDTLEDSDFFTKQGALFDEDGQIAFDMDKLIDKIVSPDTHETINEVFESITSSEIVQIVAAGFIIKNAGEKDDDPTTLQLIDFLPKTSTGAVDVNAVKNMCNTTGDDSLLDQIKIVFNAIYDLAAEPELLQFVKDLVIPAEEEPSSLKKAEGGEGEGGDDLSFILDLMDFLPQVKKVLIGQTDSSGNATGNDATTGKCTTGTCLLDSVLICNALPVLMEFLNATVSDLDLGEMTIDMSGAIAELNKPTAHENRISYKGEFAALLNIVEKLTSKDIGLNFIMGITGGQLVGITTDSNGATHIDPELLECLDPSLRAMDNSKILLSVIPGLLESALGGVLEPMLASFGSGLTIDFNCEHITIEVANLLSEFAACAPVIGAVSSIATDPSGLIGVLTDHSDMLVRLLDMFYNSKILNPDVTVGTTVVHNNNFYAILNSLLSSLCDDVDLHELDGEQWAEDYSGNTVVHGENYQLVKFLADIAASGALSEFLGNSGGSIASSAGSLDIPTLFQDVDDSALISFIAGDMFDSLILTILGIDDLNTDENALLSGISFNNIDSWAAEAESLDAVLSLTNDGFDLTNLDIMNSNGESIRILLGGLASLGCFETDEGYAFSEFIYRKLIRSLDSGTLAYFLDEGATAGSTLAELMASTTTLHAQFSSLDTAAKWADPTTGEAAKFAALLDGISAIPGGLGGINNLSYNLIPSIENLLLALNDCQSVGKVIIYNALNNVLGGMSTASLDFSLANTSYFLTATKQQRADEIAGMIDVLYTLYDPTYGLTDDSGNIDMSGLDINSLSVEFTLKPLLSTMAGTVLFGTAEDPSDLSVFANTYMTILSGTGIYDDNTPSGFDENLPFNSHTSKTLKGLINDVTDWDAEIDSFCDVLSTIQAATRFQDATGNFSMAVLSDPMSAFSGSTKENQELLDQVVTLLKAINSNEMLYRILPAKIGSGFTSLGTTGMAGTIANLANAYCVESGSGDTLDYAPYNEKEIEYLGRILFDLGSLGSLDVSDVTAINTAGLTDTLATMNLSGIFNSKKGADGFTCFQTVVKDSIFGLPLFDDLIYGANSPKDQAITFTDPSNGTTANVTDVATKRAYLTVTNFGEIRDPFGNYQQPALEDQCALLSGNGKESLKSLLDTFKSPALASLLGGSSIDFSSMNENQFKILVGALNDNALLYDGVPNTIDSIFGATGSMSCSFIDSSKIKAYTFYKVEDGVYDVNNTAVYTNHYSDEEIDNISYIVRLYGMFDKDINGKPDVVSTALSKPYLRTMMEAALNDSIVFGEAANFTA